MMIFTLKHASLKENRSSIGGQVVLFFVHQAQQEFPGGLACCLCSCAKQASLAARCQAADWQWYVRVSQHEESIANIVWSQKKTSCVSQHLQSWSKLWAPFIRLFDDTFWCLGCIEWDLQIDMIDCQCTFGALSKEVPMFDASSESLQVFHPWPLACLWHPMKFYSGPSIVRAVSMGAFQGEWDWVFFFRLMTWCLKIIPKKQSWTNDPMQVENDEDSLQFEVLRRCITTPALCILQICTACSWFMILYAKQFKRGQLLRVQSAQMFAFNPSLIYVKSAGPMAKL